MLKSLISKRPLISLRGYQRYFLPSLNYGKFFSARSVFYNDQDGVETGKVPKASNVTPATKVLRRSKKQTVSSIDKSKLLPCTTITTCESYNLINVVQLLHSKGFKDARFLIPQEVVHVTFPNFDSQSINNTRLSYDIFILVNGSVVSWGFDETFLTNEFLPLIDNAKVKSYKSFESEEMDFHIIENNLKELSDKSDIIGDIIVIDNTNLNQSLLDKAAFSFGLSRSTRLAILESKFEKCILETRKNTLDFYNGVSHKSKATQHRDTLKMMGELLLIRGELNLYSELIDTPDLYWSEPNLENFYKKISRNLDIIPRIEILNKKLDYATEESRIIISTLNEEKASKLEWIIIYLILIEVCFESFHFYERYVINPIDNTKNNI